MRVLACLSLALCAQGLTLRGTPANVTVAAQQELVAVLFETRPFISLPVVVANIQHRLPGVPIQLLYGEANKDFVKNEPTLKDAVEEGELTLTPIPGPHYSKITWAEYCFLLETPDFWRATLPAKKLLFMQTDAWLCPHAAGLLKKFMKYDYIGAPWNHSHTEGTEDEGTPVYVGNGGFTLRDREVMIETSSKYGVAGPKNYTAEMLAEWNLAAQPGGREKTSKGHAKYPWDHRWSEDAYYAIHVPNKPTREEAAGFGTGDFFSGEESVGMHKPWEQMDHGASWWDFHQDRAELVCPGLHFLRDLQKKIDDSPTFAKSEEAVKQAVAIFAKDRRRKIGASALRLRGPGFKAWFENHAVGRGAHKWNYYLDLYQRHYGSFIGKELTFVEAGVQSGGSLLMWKDVFGSQVHLHGFDIEEWTSKYEDMGVDMTIGDQTKPGDWQRLYSKAKSIDIILDDGAHITPTMITTFNEAWPNLKPGGVDSVEDITEGDAPGFVKLAAESIGSWGAQGQVASVHLYPQMLFVHKVGRANLQPSLPPASTTVHEWAALHAELPKHKGKMVALENSTWGSLVAGPTVAAIFEQFDGICGGNLTFPYPNPKVGKGYADIELQLTEVQKSVLGIHIFPGRLLVEVAEAPPTYQNLCMGTEWSSPSGQIFPSMEAMRYNKTAKYTPDRR